MSLNLQKTKRKENPIMLLLNRKKKIVLKENGKKKMHKLQKHIFFFLISLKTTMFQKIFRKTV